MRTLSIILLLFSFITGNGQSSNDLQHLNTSPILTKEQNIKWLKIIDSLSLHDKVIFLSERINNDTNIYVYQKGKDVIRLEPGRETFLSSKLKGCCKPVLLIEGKIIHLFFDGPTTYARMQLNLSIVKDLLQISNIEDITMLSGDKSASIFGPQGEDGAIIINLKDKKSKKRLRKIKSPL